MASYRGECFKTPDYTDLEGGLWCILQAFWMCRIAQTPLCADSLCNTPQKPADRV
jgi:hypothetical protein